MSTTSTHEIVILGANYAGINLVHSLLRQSIPALIKANTSQSYHVTLVSPNTHFFFKPAAPRAILDPTQIPAEKIFRSIPDALKQYGDKCTLLQGKATALNPEARIVSVDATTGSGTQDLRYDSLFICTGTTSSSPLWTLHDNHQTSINALAETNKLIASAQSILIAGGGPVGVETAGEIAHFWPDKAVVLVAGGGVLDKLKPGVGEKAKKMLAQAKVEVLENVKVDDTSADGAATVVQLSDGTARTVDLYVDARGVSKVNNEFLPKSWLDASGRVVTRDPYFRVRGDGQADVGSVYVLGDIVSGSTNTAIELDAHVSTVTSSFAVDVASKAGVDTAKSGGGLLSWVPGLSSNAIAQKEFKPLKDTILVPIGPNGGVGTGMGWQVPSLLVKKAKAERFLVELIEPLVSGTKYAQM
ncbi:FAD/NAD(P)-binding domain-containing protein [Corynespora cassiicola Philippines]|uniref:FAD/NAD(P)-binding domain-containing protein n=1 Tax=Corynespora cassiicola Philippines TaxID=1448308 RepID=A0A2T2PBX6_CORCC|nr:FAD/NAD(P)-binding domain-containing protein [Corynespora cassiicola Philippines]